MKQRSYSRGKTNSRFSYRAAAQQRDVTSITIKQSFVNRFKYEKDASGNSKAIRAIWSPLSNMVYSPQFQKFLTTFDQYRVAGINVKAYIVSKENDGTKPYQVQMRWYRDGNATLSNDIEYIEDLGVAGLKDARDYLDQSATQLLCTKLDDLINLTFAQSAISRTFNSSSGGSSYISSYIYASTMAEKINYVSSYSLLRECGALQGNELVFESDIKNYKKVCDYLDKELQFFPLLAFVITPQVKNIEYQDVRFECSFNLQFRGVSDINLKISTDKEYIAEYCGAAPGVKGSLSNPLTLHDINELIQGNWGAAQVTYSLLLGPYRDQTMFFNEDRIAVQGATAARRGVVFFNPAGNTVV